MEKLFFSSFDVFTLKVFKVLYKYFKLGSKSDLNSIRIIHRRLRTRSNYYDSNTIPDNLVYYGIASPTNNSFMNVYDTSYPLLSVERLYEIYFGDGAYYTITNWGSIKKIDITGWRFIFFNSQAN